MKQSLTFKSIYLSFILFICIFGKAFSQASDYGVNLAGLEFGPLPGTYNTNYFQPTAAELDYYSSKGLKVVRLPFLWERVQPTLGGALNTAYLGYIDNVVAAAKTRGMSVILDVHNYGRYNGNLIGSASVSIQDYKDLWARLAQHYLNETTVWAYDLMNEPHDMTVSWSTIAQAAIDTIRTIDNNHLILVEGDNWAKGDTWTTYNDNLKTLSDPAHKLIFEAHIYFDSNGSGTYASSSFSSNGATTSTGVTKITPFVDWIKNNNLRGFVGEYGVPNNATASDQTSWNTLLDNFMSYLQSNCIGGTVWAGGPAWGTSYVLSVEPTSNFTVDQPQMSVLQNYSTLAGSCAIITCPKPSLGADISTCAGGSFPFSLNSNTSTQTNVTFTWKRISPTSATLVNSSSSANTYSVSSGDGFGTYIVIRDTAGVCNSSDTIVISNSLGKPDLGSAVPNICNPAKVDLTASNANSFSAGVTWQWQKASSITGPYTDIVGATSSSLTGVRSSGYYRLGASLNSCSNSDTIQVTSSLPTPVDDCISSSGNASLSVVDPGLNGSNYNWYSTATGGVPLAAGLGTATYTTPVISSTTTYYVQDMSSVNGNVGPTTLFGQGQQWGCTDTHLLDFTASENFQLVAFKVPYETYAIAGATVTIEILDNTNAVVQTYTSDATTVSGNSGGVASLTRFTFNNGAGVTIDKTNWGSSLKMRLKLNTCTGGNPHWNDAGVSGYPFNFPATSPIVSITGSQRSNGSVNTSDYMFFYDWEITTGTICERLPVVAQVGGCSPTTGISFPSNYSKTIKVSPNPFSHQTDILLENNSGESVTVEVFNPTGNLVMKMEDVDSDKITIGETLSNGLYIIRITQDGKVYHSKMIKN